MDALLSTIVTATPRFLHRASGWRAAQRVGAHGAKRILIVGAGAAGEMVVKELFRNPMLGMYPVGFVDDDRAKHGMKIAGLAIFGPISDIVSVVRKHKVDQILIAIPRASGPLVRQVVRAAYDAGVPTRTVPALFDILSDRVSVTTIREIQIEDLLRREPVRTDLAALSELARDRVVLVTGAGGSIGSELCRQLADLRPSKLVLLDHAENPIFEIEQQIRERVPGLKVVPAITDVRNASRVACLFAEHRPTAVFHAAAHKHVPLMEENVIEAVTNNVIGTSNVVRAAVHYGVQHLVQISTDKAVRPSSVMGATKRVAEQIVSAAARETGRRFVSVRFGNVLGSQGSVVPTFSRQIKHGGPVTVTHPDMRRYFMTIPEAVQLVLQAAVLGDGADLFMLDMGEPVKIVDLARDMIRLSGFEEGRDIEIELTGIRPGEKLYEEMFFSHELAEATEHPKVLRARAGFENPPNMAAIRELIAAAEAEADEGVLRRLLARVAPDFVGAKPEWTIPTVKTKSVTAAVAGSDRPLAVVPDGLAS
jgi:FlaA1/EpsC-like NDP-sugar epimerase